jgi:hypothetical protein
MGNVGKQGTSQPRIKHKREEQYTNIGITSVVFTFHGKQLKLQIIYRCYSLFLHFFVWCMSTIVVKRQDFQQKQPWWLEAHSWVPAVSGRSLPEFITPLAVV